MRQPYNDKREVFDISDLQSLDPVEHFRAWFLEAVKVSKEKQLEPNAMAVATASKYVHVPMYKNLFKSVQCYTVSVIILSYYNCTLIFY